MHEMYDSNVNFMAYSIAEKFNGKEFKDFREMFLKVNDSIDRAKGWDVPYTDYYQAVDMAYDLIREREQKEWEEEDRRLEEEDRRLEEEERRQNEGDSDV